MREREYEERVHDHRCANERGAEQPREQSSAGEGTRDARERRGAQQTQAEGAQRGHDDALEPRVVCVCVCLAGQATSSVNYGKRRREEMKANNVHNVRNSVYDGAVLVNKARSRLIMMTFPWEVRRTR